jgi:hypothetical protein
MMGLIARIKGFDARPCGADARICGESPSAAASPASIRAGGGAGWRGVANRRAIRRPGSMT